MFYLYLSSWNPKGPSAPRQGLWALHNCRGKEKENGWIYTWSLFQCSLAGIPHKTLAKTRIHMQISQTHTHTVLTLSGNLVITFCNMKSLQYMWSTSDSNLMKPPHNHRNGDRLGNFNLLLIKRVSDCCWAEWPWSNTFLQVCVLSAKSCA